MKHIKIEKDVPQIIIRLFAAVACTRVGITIMIIINRHFKITIRMRGVRYYFKLLDPSNIIALSEIFARGVYSIFLPEPNWTIVDAGSNIGGFVLWVNDILNENCKIIAIEPEPNNFNVLSANVKDNKISNVILYNSALGDSCGFCIVKNEGGHSKIEPVNIAPTDVDLVSTENDKLIRSNTRCDYGNIIRIITIDSILSEMKLRHVDLIKIDVEGSEYKLLVGAKHALESRSITRIIMETHSEELHYECKNYLSTIGYRILLSKWFGNYKTGMLAAILPPIRDIKKGEH